MWMAAICPGQCRAAATSSAVESAPPLRATASGGTAVLCARASTSLSRPSAKGSVRTGGPDLSGFGLGVVEPAIALHALVAAIDQLAWLEVDELAPRVVQRAL